jgi:hypothetical protein
MPELQMPVLAGRNGGDGHGQGNGQLLTILNSRSSAADQQLGA